MKIQASEDMVASFTSGISCMLKSGQVCENKNADTEREGVIGEITPTKSDLTAFGTLDPKAGVDHVQGTEIKSWRFKQVRSLLFLNYRASLLWDC